MAETKIVPFLDGEVPVVADKVPFNDQAMVKEPLDTTVTDKPQRLECDALVIGAGFSGITAIHRLRKLGLGVKCMESGGDFGGVWYWNRYAGARVDSEAPFYQLNIPEVYKDWHFTQRYSDHVELRRYIAHIDRVLDLRKDTVFSAHVNSAEWDATRSMWKVQTRQGHYAEAKYVLCATGLLHRTYTPTFPGLQHYKGQIYHSVDWPKDFSAKGKKVAVVGAGATAVQITQELGKEADRLTVLLRRPSYCLPTKQREWTKVEQDGWKTYFSALFKSGRDSFTGYPCQPVNKGVYDVSEEERVAHWETMWERGGVHFALSNFYDVGINEKANEAVYQFWRKKVCERLTDPHKNEIMAPERKPYYFGGKRNPLETDYYEVLNRSNVDIHDLGAVPLKSFCEKGLIMADETQYELDAIVLATGFDSYTGSLTHMGLKNKEGVELADLWKDGVSTYMGLTISGFPNLFLSYSPQSPVPLSNATTIIEAQVETIVDMIAKLERENASSIEPQRSAEKEWKEICHNMAQMTLISQTDSWWNGANIPGKKAETMIYVGGVNTYEALCRQKMEGWQGYDVTVAA